MVTTLAVPENRLSWQPTAPLPHLRERAALLTQLRHFFAARGVMEVDTQLLSHCAVSDPFIDTVEANYRAFPGAETEPLFLQTSPEYAMKRLLAAGSGDIYQLGKVFRNGEAGARHNPEFTLLEWYRLGWNLEQLMDEVQTLVAGVLPQLTFQRIRYRTLFRQRVGLDPLQASLVQLKAVAAEAVETGFEDEDRDTWLNLIMSHIIEPTLEQGVFVYDFPASQAALARRYRDAEGGEVAARFELYVDGLELANGYDELTDAQEQAQRLQADQHQRAALGLPQRPLEQRLVAALRAGMPPASGVALGVDRLLMCRLGCRTIAEVLPFAFARA